MIVAHARRADRARARRALVIAFVGAVLSVAILGVPTPASATYGFHSVFSVVGPGDDNPSHIGALATEADGDILVGDSTHHRIERFSSDGRLLHTWGSLSDFDKPTAIAVGPSGAVYVGDDTCRVQRFSPQGERLASWEGCDRFPDENGDITGVATDAAENVYVVSASVDGKNRLLKFSPDGELLDFWGADGSAEGRFATPIGVAVGPDDTVYVADLAQDTVTRFTADGALLDTWGPGGPSDGGIFGVRGVATDTRGHVFVLEHPPSGPWGAALDNRVQEFTADGRFVSEFACLGHDRVDGKLSDATELTTAPNNDVLIGSFRGVERFTEPGKPSPCVVETSHFGTRFSEYGALAVCLIHDCRVKVTGRMKLRGKSARLDRERFRLKEEQVGGDRMHFVNTRGARRMRNVAGPRKKRRVILEITATDTSGQVEVEEQKFRVRPGRRGKGAGT